MAPATILFTEIRQRSALTRLIRDFFWLNISTKNTVCCTTKLLFAIFMFMAKKGDGYLRKVPTEIARISSILQL